MKPTHEKNISPTVYPSCPSLHSTKCRTAEHTNTHDNNNKIIFAQKNSTGSNWNKMQVQKPLQKAIPSTKQKFKPIQPSIQPTLRNQSELQLTHNESVWLKFLLSVLWATFWHVWDGCSPRQATKLTSCATNSSSTQTNAREQDICNMSCCVDGAARCIGCVH